ncbi:MAG: WG repeat-containing protein [Eubacteriales bacterium]|nr:WG repeat-containing protein [Eubacteriales bacterium]
MKKKAAAALLLAGMLCVLALAILPKTDKPDPSGSADPTETQENEQVTLSDYITAGDSVVTALDSGTSISRLIPFAVNGRYALANQDAVPVTDAIYNQVELLSADSGTFWALYEDDQVTCVSETGELIVPPTAGTLKLLDEQYLSCTKPDGTTNLYQTDGSLVAALNGKPHSCQDGVLVSKNTDGTWSLTDTSTWESVTVSDIRRIGTFSDGIAIVKLAARNWGLIDKTGEITPLPGMVRLWDVCDGYILAKDSQGAYGVLTTEGTIVLPFEYYRAKVCSDDLPIYQLWTADGECIVRNVKSKQSIRLPSAFDGQKLTAWPNHYYSFRSNTGMLILFDDLGRLELPGETDLVLHNDTLLVACDGAQFSTIRLSEGTQGKSLSGRYLSIDGLTDPDMAYLAFSDTQTGLQGICDSSGKLVLEAEYDWIRPTGSGLFAAEQGEVCGLVDSRGRWQLCLQK